MTETGVYLLANDAVLDEVIACLHSLRAVEPLLPICIVPFDDRNQAVREVARRYELLFWEEKTILAWCDQLSLRFHPFSAGQYRKLSLWFGPFERFLYLDVDTIVLRPLRELFILAKEYSFVLATAWLPAIRRFVWKDECELETAFLDTDFAANTGFVLSSRSALSRTTLERLVDEAVVVREQMNLDCMEQPLLNYVIQRSGGRYTSLNRLRQEGRNLPVEVWAQRMHDDALAHDELPLFIHWAGLWQTGMHKRSLYWKHFRELAAFLPQTVSHAGRPAVPESPGASLLPGW